MTKLELFDRGQALIREFCHANSLIVPSVNAHARSEWHYGKTCAYYRPVEIHICIPACAHIGTAAMAWSYPGYSVDRTPFGVLAHEVGHHADWTKSGKRGPYFGDYSIGVKNASGEERLTSYCPNTAEWFAEMFRLFITNPDLLKIIRPRTYARIREDFFPVQHSSWDYVLRDAPERTFEACRKKVERYVVA